MRGEVRTAGDKLKTNMTPTSANTGLERSRSRQPEPPAAAAGRRAAGLETWPRGLGRSPGSIRRRAWAVGALALVMTGTAGAAPGHPLQVAQAALDAGDPAAALVAVAGATGLDDYRALLAGRAHLALGQLDAARSVVAGVADAPPTGAKCKPGCNHPLRDAVAELRAASWAAAAPEKAAAILAALPAYGARLSRAAELYDRAKDRPAADAIRRRLLIEAPVSSEARALASALTPKGVMALLATDAARLARAKALLAAHDNAAAKQAARLLIASGHQDRCALRYIEGKACRKLRQYSAATTALAKARHACAAAGDTNYKLRSMLLETQVRSIKGHVGKAKGLATAIAGDHPEHSYADDALLAYANTLERKGRTSAAKAIYERILQAHAAGDQVPVAAWRIAFHAIRRGALTEARPALRAILNGASASTRDGARARYWLARSFESDDRAEAVRLFEASITAPPLTFYAWLALDRLRRIDAAQATRVEAQLLARRDGVTTASAAPDRVAVASRRPGNEPGAAKTEAAARDHAAEPSRRSLGPIAEAGGVAASEAAGDDGAGSIRRRAGQLHAIGWSDAAFAELALLEHRTMSEPETVALALAYDEVGAHQAAQWLLRTSAGAALARFPAGDALRIWRVAYSQPFTEPLTVAADAEKVDPLLLYALSREESTFDPQIVSWAGATGLTQLMPATAVGAYATVYRKRLTDLSVLTDPALNLRLGAHVLGDGLRRFGVVPLALAAYNGGPGLASRTLPRSKAIDFDLWVETISVRETRRYVKRVIGTWGKYRFLYDGKSPFIDLPDAIEPRS